MTHHGENLTGLLSLIVGCIKDILSYIKGHDHSSFVNDKKTLDACVMKLQVIGELCKSISEKYPSFDQFAYKKIIGLRNIISHDYFGIDRDEIRAICNLRLISLKKEIQIYLRN